MTETCKLSSKAFVLAESVCSLYQVEVMPVTGRTLVAKRAIKPGDIILSEAPLLFGPKQLSAPMCVGCHKAWDPALWHRGGSSPDDAEIYFCSMCGWPLCGSECEKSPFHEPECQLIRGWRKSRSEIHLERMVNSTGVYGSVNNTVGAHPKWRYKHRNPFFWKKYRKKKQQANKKKTLELDDEVSKPSHL